MKQFTVVGAGLVGSLLSIYLGKEGHQVKLFERRPDARRADIYAGKSINLALSDRGWKALEIVGAADAIRKVAIPMTKRIMHAVDGTLTEQPYGKDGQAIYSVSRGGLNIELMNLAEAHSNVELFFNEKCVKTDLDNATVDFKNYETGADTSVKADYVFGADGAFSAVRAEMQRTDRFNYEQEYIEHGYKELEIPANADGSHKLERDALHIWPRGEYMLIALPNLDGSFTCTLFFPYEGENSFASLQTDEQIMKFFNETFADAVPLMPELLDHYKSNPTSSLCIIRAYPWVKGNTVLIGDAAHAIVPFYGQGMNCAFEDCTVLTELVEKHGDNWEAIFEDYQQSRKPDGDAIADLAMRNFVEMRDLTGDPMFLLQKKIEKKFAALHPNKWMPLYSMVTFSHIRYSDALKTGQAQDKIMEKVMAMPAIESNWDSEEVMEKMLALIS